MWHELTTTAFEIIRPALPFFILTYLGYGLFDKASQKESDSLNKTNRERLLAARSAEEQQILREWEEKRHEREQKRILDQIYK